MGEWIRMVRGRVRVEAAPPFVRFRIEGAQVHGWSALAEAIVAVEVHLPDERVMVNLRVRDSHESSRLDGRLLNYAFRTRDEAEVFEHAVLSALAHAGKWRRG